MSWRSSFRCSKFRHVFGKPATRERSYDGLPITRSVHDNHFCSANPCFIAVVTECNGGGSFLVLPVRQVCKGQHERGNEKLMESGRNDDRSIIID